MKKICFIFCCFFMFALNVFADDLYSISYDASGALEVRKNNATTNDYASALTADTAGNIVLKEGVSIDTITTVNKSISITSNNKEISINSINVGTSTASNLTINNAKLTFGGDVTSSGNITVNDSTINIQGGDFGADGNMSFNNSTIKGNAHKYVADGTLTVTDTTIQGLVDVYSVGKAIFTRVTTNTTANSSYGDIGSNSELLMTDSDIKTEAVVFSRGNAVVRDTTINVPVCHSGVCGFIEGEDYENIVSKLTNVTVTGEAAIIGSGSLELDNVSLNPSFIVFDGNFNGSKFASGSITSVNGYLKIKNSDLTILHLIGADKNVEITSTDINFDLDSLVEYIEDNNIVDFIHGLFSFQTVPTTDYKISVESSNFTGDVNIVSTVPVEISSTMIDSTFIEMNSGDIVGATIGSASGLTIESSDINIARLTAYGNSDVSIDYSRVVFSILNRIYGNLTITNSIYIVDNREVDNTFIYPVYVEGNTTIENSTVKFISQYNKAAFTTAGTLTIDEKMVKINNNKNNLSLLEYSSVPADINIDTDPAKVYYLGTGTNTESTYDILTTYKKVTFKIKNGTWADGTNDDIVIEVEFGHVLTEDEIPTNMKALDKTHTGRWEEELDEFILDDTTFNYIFEKITNPNTGVREVLVPLLLLALGLIFLRREIIDKKTYYRKL